MADYLSGLLEGYFSDKFLGSCKAITTSRIVMGLGLFTVWEPTPVLYGLGLIIAGNGFFKPNISTIVSGLYPKGDKRRDGALTSRNKAHSLFSDPAGRTSREGETWRKRRRNGTHLACTCCSGPRPQTVCRKVEGPVETGYRQGWLA